jgi:hypothetical protein
MGKLCGNLLNNLVFEYIWPLILKIHPWKDQIGYIHNQRNHLVQGLSALKRLGFITFET